MVDVVVSAQEATIPSHIARVYLVLTRSDVMVDVVVSAQEATITGHVAYVHHSALNSLLGASISDLEAERFLNYRTIV